MSLSASPARRPMVTVLAVCAFAIICVVGLYFGMRGLVAPAKLPADPRPPSSTPAPKSAAAVSFSSPSGNIRCSLSARSVRCDIADQDWAGPTAPTGCPTPPVSTLTLSSEKAELSCAGSTLPSGPVLGYGKTQSFGDFRCSSERTGVTCANARGAGFSLSRSAYALRIP